MLVEVGDRVRWIAERKFRYGDWPANAWVQKGVKGTVTKIYPASSEKEYSPEERVWYTVPAAASVKWDNGGQSLIYDDGKGQVWEKITDTGSVKGEQAGMLGVPGKVHTQKQPYKAGQMEFESYTKYQEAMPRSEEVIRQMRKDGKEWSEVEDWITRQVGYDKEAIDWAREIYYSQSNEAMPLERDLHWKTVTELKQMCSQRGLPTDGGKEDLIRRLK